MATRPPLSHVATNDSIRVERRVEVDQIDRCIGNGIPQDAERIIPIAIADDGPLLSSPSQGANERGGRLVAGGVEPSLPDSFLTQPGSSGAEESTDGTDPAAREVIDHPQPSRKVPDADPHSSVADSEPAVSVRPGLKSAPFLFWLPPPGR